MFDLDWDAPVPVVEVDPGGAPLNPSPLPPTQAEVPQAASDFVPGSRVWPPSGAKARAEANLAALDTLAAIELTGRPATRAEQEVLAAWSSWGALPKVFDDADPEWSDVRARLRARLDDREWAAAAATTINAHYTDPVVVAEVWRGLERLGFAGGRVLEPGCGSGTFIGASPAGAEMVGVELDPVTARIAAALYPSAQIRAEGFETTRLSGESFLAAVGNVPFGKVTLHDPTHNRAGHSIHNHFIVKSLRLCTPGGMVAVVTSRYTMDAQNPAARREMAQLADLVGAIRLPTGAMRRVAGTDVVCDVLMLRRREPDREPSALPWERTVEVDTAGGPVRMSEYFAAHPEMIVGEATAARGMYRDGDMVIHSDLAAMPGALGAAMDRLAVGGTERGLLFTARPGDEARAATLIDPSAIHTVRKPKLGSIVATDVGFASFGVDGFVNFDVPKSLQRELRELLKIRDVTLDLLDAQSTGRPPEISDALRAELNARYDTYVATHGPISRWRWATSSREGAEPRKVVPRLGGFRNDPDCSTVMALEDFDAEDQAARKMPIFTRDVLAPVTEHLGAETAADALAITLAETARVDVERIAELLGTDSDQARASLEDLVFADPATGRLVTAAEYLSGDVRTKLAQAREAAADDERWAINVERLMTVQPRDLVADEITARPGAAWIPATDIEAFLVEVLDVPPAEAGVRRSDATGDWMVQVPSWAKHCPVCTAELGTQARNAVDLLDATLNQRQVAVYQTNPDGSRVLLGDETALAKERQELLIARFSQWLFDDSARRERLVAEYNRRFNSHVHRVHDGSHLELPGLSTTFAPRPHQLAAVARIVAEPAVLLDHAVGAGKTGTMVMAGMEMRRLGLVRQPWFVVPNHMLEQFATEFKQWYPAANILVGRDLTAKTRREFVARTATGDWDGVVITQSAFGLIGVSEQVLTDYLAAQVGRFTDELLALREAGDRVSIKKLERAKLQLAERIKARIDQARKDTGVTFDGSGCDYLFVDEAHHFKNLSVPSKAQELSVKGSIKAEDLAMKLGWLRERNGGRCATFATGTPIANSMREMFVMQRYLAPDDLEAAGIEHFDAWVAQFCAAKTALELGPTGSSHRLKSRIAGFVNAPELVGMYRRFADVMLTENLNLPTPTLAGGARTTRIIEPSAQLTAFIEDLGQRAQAITNRQVDPTEDNMLKITSEGRLAALDPRCVGMRADPDGGKVAAITAEVARIYRATAERRYLDAYGEPARRAGGMQIVFCDRSTPKRDTWNFYDELRSQLVTAGIPAEQIRFVHDAGDDRKKKEELFAACRDGRVSVLIGSTERMGVGTNIQARAVALHHADCPWRPADLEQREGRILRQGNQNDEVEILAYATEASFDVYMWQLLERKARFIGQLRSGNLVARSLDDLGDEAALSYAEIKALASGNPLILERATVEAEVARLERLRTMHGVEQSRIAARITSLGEERGRQVHAVTQADAAVGRVVDTRGDKFSAVVRGRRIVDRKDVGPELQTALATALTDLRLRRATNEVVATIGGIDVRLRADPGWDVAALEFDDLPVRRLDFDRVELRSSDALGLIRQIEHRLHSLPEVRERAAERISEIDHEVEGLAALCGRPFDGADRLTGSMGRLEAIDAKLADTSDDAPPERPGGPVCTERKLCRLASPQDLGLARTVEAATGVPGGHVRIGIIGR